MLLFQAQGRGFNLTLWRWEAPSGLRSAGICASAYDCFNSQDLQVCRFHETPLSF
jgi:hypothetical protein